MGLIFDTPLARMEDLTLFTRHLAGAMDAKVPMPVVLRAFVAEYERSALTRAASKMADEVEQGVALSVAMESHPKVFQASYRRIVKMGEQGRILGGVMDRLAVNLEQGLRSYEYFRRVAVYPLVILGLLFVVASFILVFIIPKFQDIYSQLGAELPLQTTMVISLAAGGKWTLLYVLAFMIPIGYLLGCVFGVRFRLGGYGRFALSMPLIGGVLRRMETSRFAANLGMLLRAGVPLSEALGLLEDSSSNAYVRDAIADFHQRYARGEKLGDMLHSQPLFPASMAVMIASAEDRGALPDTLESLATFYAERTAQGLVVLRELFEPLMLVVVGLILGGLVLAMYVPMFNLPKTIGAL